jgi:hemerythrin-like domain-containing protein
MKPTEALKKEHEAIKLMLRILEEVSERLESGEKVGPERPESILEFIRVFADKCHHGKEEGLLFPAMEKVGIPRARGPIGVMLFEHKEGRNFVKGMSEAVEKYADGLLSAAAQEELEKGFERIETEVIGTGRHEEFHGLLHRLKEEYLKQA